MVRKYPPGFAIRFNSRWAGVAVERSVVRSSDGVYDTTHHGRELSRWERDGDVVERDDG
ncbi:hypothetical protein [Streptomonospora alba]|uniref:hypothetical protein n=1 Tax=Streptomonospora alba TaxID=183763 RepID=UPI0012EE0211|nr:hypothetical protein [Streptomonospora alba]